MVPFRKVIAKIGILVSPPEARTLGSIFFPEPPQLMKISIPMAGGLHMRSLYAGQDHICTAIQGLSSKVCRCAVPSLAKTLQ